MSHWACGRTTVFCINTEDAFLRGEINAKCKHTFNQTIRDFISIILKL